jgi:hypothetical protein
MRSNASSVEQYLAEPPTGRRRAIDLALYDSINILKMLY